MSSPAVTEALMLQHRRSWNVEQQVAKLTTDRVETGSLDMLRGSLNVLQNRCNAGDRTSDLNSVPGLRRATLRHRWIPSVRQCKQRRHWESRLWSPLATQGLM